MSPCKYTVLSQYLSPLSADTRCTQWHHSECTTNRISRRCWLKDSDNIPPHIRTALESPPPLPLRSKMCKSCWPHMFCRRNCTACSYWRRSQCSSQLHTHTPQIRTCTRWSSTLCTGKKQVQSTACRRWRKPGTDSRQSWGKSRRCRSRSRPFGGRRWSSKLCTSRLSSLGRRNCRPSTRTHRRGSTSSRCCTRTWFH